MWSRVAGLLHQKGQHRKVHKDGGKVLFAQAIVLVQIVALVLQGVEGQMFSLADFIMTTVGDR